MRRKSGKGVPETKLKSPSGGKPSVATSSTALKSPKVPNIPRQGTSDQPMVAFGKWKVTDRGLKK